MLLKTIYFSGAVVTGLASLRTFYLLSVAMSHQAEYAAAQSYAGVFDRTGLVDAVGDMHDRWLAGLWWNAILWTSVTILFALLYDYARREEKAKASEPSLSD